MDNNLKHFIKNSLSSKFWSFWKASDAGLSLLADLQWSLRFFLYPIKQMHFLSLWVSSSTSPLHLCWKPVRNFLVFFMMLVNRKPAPDFCPENLWELQWFTLRLFYETFVACGFPEPLCFQNIQSGVLYGCTSSPKILFVEHWWDYTSGNCTIQYGCSYLWSMEDNINIRFLE